MSETLWFRVAADSGHPRAGQLHLKGWRLTAIGEPYAPSGQVGVGICPVCAATVFTDKQTAYGDLSWEHEQWHARTDYPVPDGI